MSRPLQRRMVVRRRGRSLTEGRLMIREMIREVISEIDVGFQMEPAGSKLATSWSY